jgi:hypothetical protein
MLATEIAVVPSPTRIACKEARPEPAAPEGKTFYVVTAAIGLAMFVLCGISIICLLAVFQNNS